MFIAPEQLRDSTTVDTRSDIYSLGCTLYALLAGHPPFQGNTTDDVMRQHFDVEPPVIPGAATDVMRILQRALQKQPEDRYQSATEIAAELREFLRRAASGRSPI
jgi:serine/threonine protein kinase